MVTSGYPNLVEFERSSPKIEHVCAQCVALVAGSAVRYGELLRAVRREVGHTDDLEVAWVVEKVKEKYDEFRTRVLEQSIFRPRGLTRAEFYGRMSTFPQPVIRELDTVCATFDYEVQFVICGVDTAGGHIHLVLNPGHSECLDAVGFSAIGTGAIHASHSLIANGAEPGISLQRGVYLAYEAKRRSEVAPGVGSGTGQLSRQQRLRT